MSVGTVHSFDGASHLRSMSDKKEQDRQAIRALAGCYTVTFDFAETFAEQKDYEFRERYHEEAKEFAFIIEETEDKIAIQHILYATETALIKHWRQDWIYENQDVLTFVRNHEWKKDTLPADAVAGTWTQKVYQVDDAPRYEGYGTWVHVDGRHFWQSFAEAPIPRRDSQVRSDYNLLRRGSHIEVFQDGSWVIDQDNKKLIREADGTDTLLCQEKGIELFTPRAFDPEKALAFWEARKEFWTDVRAAWDHVIATSAHIRVDEHKKLYQGQFRLAERFAGEQYDADASKAAIAALFKEHLVLA